MVDERLLGSDYVIGELRMPLRQITPYQLTHYHVYMDKKVTVSCLLPLCVTLN